MRAPSPSPFPPLPHRGPPPIRPGNNKLSRRAEGQRRAPDRAKLINDYYYYHYQQYARRRRRNEYSAGKSFCPRSPWARLPFPPPGLYYFFIGGGGRIYSSADGRDFIVVASDGRSRRRGETTTVPAREYGEIINIIMGKKMVKTKQKNEKRRRKKKPRITIKRRKPVVRPGTTFNYSSRVSRTLVICQHHSRGADRRDL